MIEYPTAREAKSAAGKGEYAALISTTFTRDEHGFCIGQNEVWGLFKRPKMSGADFADRCRNGLLRRPETESSGPYRGSLSDEVAGF